MYNLPWATLKENQRSFVGSKAALFASVVIANYLFISVWFFYLFFLSIKVFHGLITRLEWFHNITASLYKMLFLGRGCYWMKWRADWTERFEVVQCRCLKCASSPKKKKKKSLVHFFLKENVLLIINELLVNNFCWVLIVFSVCMFHVICKQERGTERCVKVCIPWR